MATIDTLAKRVRNTAQRNSQIFFKAHTGSAYTYVNAGRVTDANFESEPVATDADQDGRESTTLFDITVQFTMMQGSNVELSMLPDLAMPDATNFPNGHSIYFSGGPISTTELNTNTTNDQPDYSALSSIGQEENGLFFVNVLLKPSPTIPFNGDASLIPLEFNGRLPHTAFTDLDDTSAADGNHLVISQT